MNNESSLSAYQNWLLVQDNPVKQLILDTKEQNPQAGVVLELTDDDQYNEETFYKAIHILLERKEK